MKKVFTLTTLMIITIISFAQFQCGNNLVDSRDGQIYPTVQIGSQCWFAKNLNYGTYTESTSLGVPHSNVSNNGTVEKYCYDNVEDSCLDCGGFYEWDEMMSYTTINGVQGICPDGWHIPTDEEWKELEMALGMTQTDADNLGQRGTDEGAQLLSSGTSGFDAMFKGYRYAYGIFSGAGQEAYFWTSTIAEDDANDAYYRALRSNSTKVERGKEIQLNGFSVRCLLGEGMAVNDLGKNDYFLSSPVPNPATTIAKLSYHLPANIEDAELVLYDILGSEVKRIDLQQNSGHIELGVNSFKKGTYVYQLEFDNRKSTTKKLVVH